MRDEKGVFFCGKVFLTSVFTSTIFCVASASAYTITYNANGALFDNGQETNEVVYDDSHNVTSGEEKNPYMNSPVSYELFWSTDTVGKKRVNLGDITSDTTLYAQYKNVVWNFGYTGGEQTFTLPYSKYIRYELWGAEGGKTDPALVGGYGGYSRGFASLSIDTVVNIVNGEAGSTEDRYTYNGGGRTGANASAPTGSGGGATHVAFGSGVLADFVDHKDDVLIVAGAGGGSTANNTGLKTGGSGGGFQGGLGAGTRFGGRGGTQTAGGKLGNVGTLVDNRYGGFGLGGNPEAPTTTFRGGGGGAGWYGGAGGGFAGDAKSNGGGGGGSGYVASANIVDGVMYGYKNEIDDYAHGFSIPTNDEEGTRTYQTENYAYQAITGYAKQGDGYTTLSIIMPTITYKWGDNEESMNIVYREKATLTDIDPSRTTHPHYDMVWQLNGVDYDFDTPVTEDIVLVAKYTPIVYNLSYNLNGSTVTTPNPTTYTVESAPITLNNPITPDYYTFKGWSGTDLDGNENENVTIVTGSYGDREYTANFTPIEYTINYVLDGGENSSRNPSSYNVESSIQLADAYKEGYDFTGWVEGSEIALGSHGDKTFTATYEIKHYNVTVNYDNSEVFNDTIDHGSDFPTLNIPEVAPGYERKYYNNGAEYDITQPVAGDLDITIVDEIITYNITYVMDGHTNDSNNPTSYTVNDADIVIADAEPKAYYYYFLGWTTNPNTEEDMTKDFEIPSGSTGDITLYAIFQQNPYTIEFDCEDFCEFEPITRIGEEPIGELPTPERDGYIFLGWYIDDNKLEPTSTPRSSATAVAKWEKIEAPNTGDNILKAATVFVLSSLALVALIIKKK